MDRHVWINGMLRFLTFRYMRVENRHKTSAVHRDRLWHLCSHSAWN